MELEVFSVWDYMNNICLQVNVCTYIFIILGKHLGVELTGHKLSVYLT